MFAPGGRGSERRINRRMRGFGRRRACFPTYVPSPHSGRGCPQAEHRRVGRARLPGLGYAFDSPPSLALRKRRLIRPPRRVPSRLLERLAARSLHHEGDTLMTTTTQTTHRSAPARNRSPPGSPFLKEEKELTHRRRRGLRPSPPGPALGPAGQAVQARDRGRHRLSPAAGRVPEGSGRHRIRVCGPPPCPSARTYSTATDPVGVAVHLSCVPWLPCCRGRAGPRGLGQGAAVIRAETRRGEDALGRGPQRVRVAAVAMQDHHPVHQLLGEWLSASERSKSRM